MKRLFLALIVLIAFAATVSAGVPQPFSVYAGGAISLPQSPDAFKDGFKTGYHGSVGVGYKFMPAFQVVGKVEYHTFNIDWDSDPLLAGYTDLEGGTSKFWMFGCDGRYSFNMPASPVKPFVFGGVGMAAISQSTFTGGTTLITSTLNEARQDASKFYFNVGGGVDLKTGPAWSLFAQLRWVSVATDNDSWNWVPLTLGVKFF